MGGIGWSDWIVDATCSDCYISGCLNGFGSIDVSDNSDITLTGNTIRSCGQSGIYMLQAYNSQAAGRIVINGNRIYACPIGIYISDEPGYTTTSTVPNRITISNNSFDLCTTYSIQMTNSAYISITGNRFEGPTGSNTVKHIVATDVQQVVIGGNIFNGAAYGIYVDNPEIGVQNVTVQGNTFSSQYAGAIRFFQDGVYGLALAGCQASGNVISNDATAGNGYVGINLNWPTMAKATRSH